MPKESKIIIIEVVNMRVSDVDESSLNKKIYFWNAFGGIVNAGISVVILMTITHTTGTYDAGIFSLGYANAMLFLNIGTLDTRSYQCADASGRYKFSDYYTFRLCTCIFMMLLVCIFVAINRYSLEKAMSTFLICLYIMLGNISDIYQGNAQVIGRLDLGGQSLALRGIINLVIFCFTYILTGNLFIALLLMDISACLWLGVFDRKCIGAFESPEWNWNFKIAKGLLKATVPLGLCLTLQVGIFNMPKYAIDRYLPVEMQTIYNILFMPAFVINLFGLMIYRPILVELSLLWEEKKKNAIKKLLLGRIAAMGIVTVGVTAAGYVLGPLFLSILYGVDILPYRKEFLLLLIGGGFTGVVNLLYFMVTVMKKQRWMLVSYTITFVLSYFLSYPFVYREKLLGASMSYLITSVVINILMGLLICCNMKGKKRRE